MVGNIALINGVRAMQVTINVPTFSGLRAAVAAKFGRKPLAQATETASAPAPAPTFGCYRDKATGTWFSYWTNLDTCYVVLPPTGVNAKEYARVNKNVVPTGEDHKSYSCTCEKCAGTGQMFGKKCFRCDGKGWMSPIDLDRFASYQSRQAAAKGEATKQRRKNKAA